MSVGPTNSNNKPTINSNNKPTIVEKQNTKCDKCNGTLAGCILATLQEEYLARGQLSEIFSPKSSRVTYIEKEVLFQLRPDEMEKVINLVKAMSGSVSFGVRISERGESNPIINGERQTHLPQDSLQSICYEGSPNLLAQYEGNYKESVMEFIIKPGEASSINLTGVDSHESASKTCLGNSAYPYKIAKFSYRIEQMCPRARNVFVRKGVGSLVTGAVVFTAAVVYTNGGSIISSVKSFFSSLNTSSGSRKPASSDEAPTSSPDSSEPSTPPSNDRPESPLSTPSDSGTPPRDAEESDTSWRSSWQKGASALEEDVYGAISSFDNNSTSKKDENVSTDQTPTQVASEPDESPWLRGISVLQNDLETPTGTTF